jgi:hypothetical protein
MVKYNCSTALRECNSADIFQKKVSILMQGLEFVRAYLDNLLRIIKRWLGRSPRQAESCLSTTIQAQDGKSTLRNHPSVLQDLSTLTILLRAISIEPVPKKIKAIQNIQPPKTICEVRRFVGMINYYQTNNNNNKSPRSDDRTLSHT